MKSLVQFRCRFRPSINVHWTIIFKTTLKTGISNFYFKFSANWGVRVYVHFFRWKKLIRISLRNKCALWHIKLEKKKKFLHRKILRIASQKNRLLRYKQNIFFCNKTWNFFTWALSFFVTAWSLFYKSYLNLLWLSTLYNYTAYIHFSTSSQWEWKKKRLWSLWLNKKWYIYFGICTSFKISLKRNYISTQG